MIGEQKKRRSKLDKLTEAQREEAFAHCETVTIPKGLEWLKETYDLQVGSNALSRWLKWRRLKMNASGAGRKIRPDSKMARLAVEDQAAIEAHCKNASLDESVKWIKETIKLDISTSSLGTWLLRRKIERKFATRLEQLKGNSMAAKLMGETFGAAAALTEANVVMIAQAVFEELNKEEKERDEKRLIQYMKLALQGRSITLAYDKFQFDAAKAASRRGEEIRAIQEGPGDEREKLEKVIHLLFGEEPEGFEPSTESDPNGNAVAWE